MGQQCSQTTVQVQEVLVHHFEPFSDELKMQIETMRKKNKELLEVVQKHISSDKKQQFLGYMQNGVKQGYGELKTSEQKRYYGYFRDNLPHIKGALVFSNQHYYIGQFHMGKMHGKGKQISPFFTFQGQFHFDHQKYGRLVTEEFKYQGSFQQQSCLFGGYEELRFKNGEKYIGNFSKGCFNGQGMYFDQNNSLLYQGGWKNGVYDGIGKYYWEDGSYFQGEYLNGFKHGQGKFTALGEEFVCGVWQDGLITSRYVDKISNQEQNLRNNKSAHSTKVQQIY